MSKELAAAIDLDAMMPVETTIIEIMKPGGIEGTGWQVVLGGPAHPKAISWSNEKSRQGLRRQQQLEAQQLNGRKIKPEDKDIEEARRDNVGWVVSRIVGWTPVKIGGQVIEFSDAAASELLVKPEMGWVLTQLVDALADERSFTKRSASS